MKSRDVFVKHALPDAAYGVGANAEFTRHFVGEHSAFERSDRSHRIRSHAGIRMMRLAQTCADGMDAVVGRARPFDIFDGVVHCVSVLMVGLSGCARRRSMKGASDQATDAHRLPLSIAAKGDRWIVFTGAVLAPVIEWTQDAAGFRAIAERDTPDPADTGHFVVRLMFENRPPFLAGKCMGVEEIMALDPERISDKAHDRQAWSSVQRDALADTPYLAARGISQAMTKASADDSVAADLVRLEAGDGAKLHASFYRKAA